MQSAGLFMKLYALHMLRGRDPSFLHIAGAMFSAFRFTLKVLLRALHFAFYHNATLGPAVYWLPEVRMYIMCSPRFEPDLTWYDQPRSRSSRDVAADVKRVESYEGRRKCGLGANGM